MTDTLQNRPIGVFDSGVGGLTVVRALMERLPLEHLIYYGDTARVPYGVKSRATIETYSAQIVAFLLAQRVKALVIACNTVSGCICTVTLSRISKPDEPLPHDVLCATAFIR